MIDVKSHCGDGGVLLPFSSLFSQKTECIFDEPNYTRGKVGSFILIALNLLARREQESDFQSLLLFPRRSKLLISRDYNNNVVWQFTKKAF